MDKIIQIIITKVMLIIIFCSITLSGYSANPGDGDNLYVFTKGATKAIVYSLDNLDKMTFSDNGMSLWTNNKKFDYNYDSIALMTFRDGIKPVNGIERLTIAEADIIISYDHNSKQISVESEEPMASVSIYDLQGRTVARQNIITKCSYLSLADQPQGVYIIKVQGVGISRSMKIIK